MEANKILSADVLDIIFEDRNKDYGAYDLRKTYNKRIVLALVITASIALLALLGSIIASQLTPKSTGPEKKKEFQLQAVVQEKPPEEVLPPPPPPPKPPDPPKVELTKFTPPKIVEDEKVVEPPPPQEELKTENIAAINQEGIEDKEIKVDVVDQGTGIVQQKVEEDPNKVFEKVEIEASFKGGEAAWRKYLERNLNANTPVDNNAPEGTYTVWVQFIVDKDGAISDVKALSNHGYGMEEEAVKVIKKGPAWVPAVQNGRQVKAYRKQPITFVVTSE